MKKSILLLLLMGSLISSEAQISNLFSKKKTKTDSTAAKQQVKPQTVQETKPVVPVVDLKKVDVSRRAADHFMMQFGYDTWFNRPDSVATKGFSRHFNIYGMIDKPFEKDHRYSLGIGAGFGTSNIYFDGKYVDVKANSVRLPFRSAYGADSSNFNKYKVTTMYFEVPAEIRYYSKPQDPMHSWKVALGAKFGFLLKAYGKGKDLKTKNGYSVYGQSYILKEYDKQFFNSTKVALTGRVGYGIFSLNTEYNILGVLKQGAGADMHLFQVGLTISGL